jgi:hypothetical protein
MGFNSGFKGLNMRWTIEMRWVEHTREICLTKDELQLLL